MANHEVITEKTTYRLGLTPIEALVVGMSPENAEKYLQRFSELPPEIQQNALEGMARVNKTVAEADRNLKAFLNGV